MPNKLPTYYEKYFDEKFGRVEEGMAGLRKDLGEVNTHLKELNGRVVRNKENIFKLATVIAFATPMYISESRHAILSFISSILGF